MDIPMEDGAREGGRGGRAGMGKIQAFPSKFEFAWEKKGGRKGGRAQREWVWKISGAGQGLGKSENRRGGSQKEEA